MESFRVWEKELMRRDKKKKKPGNIVEEINLERERKVPLKHF